MPTPEPTTPEPQAKLPWKIGKNHPNDFVRRIKDAADEIVCEVSGSTPEEAEANALLVTQAVNAHKSLLNTLEYAIMNLEGYEQQNNCVFGMLPELRAALAAATQEAR